MVGEEEVSEKHFDLVKWIRDGKLHWIEHILRMRPEWKLNQVIFEMFKAPRQYVQIQNSHTQNWTLSIELVRLRYRFQSTN